jgi:glycerol-3-phosphate acyltransferase PlsY
VWLTAAALTRISSAGALAAFVAAPLVAGLTGAPPPVTALAAIVAVLVWVRHHANIRRLLAGTEPTIGRRAPGASPSAGGPSADGPSAGAT